MSHPVVHRAAPVPPPGRVLETEQWVPASLDRTFAFFSDAGNLESITPAFLCFRIATPPPITMRAGAEIEYRLRLFGVPVRWRTRIDDWDPGRGFVDTQLRGPYARWVHRHSFAVVDGGVRVSDRIEYALPLEPLTHPVHVLFVRPSLRRIFDYRRDAIARALGPDPGGDRGGVRFSHR